MDYIKYYIQHFFKDISLHPVIEIETTSNEKVKKSERKVLNLHDQSLEMFYQQAKQLTLKWRHTKEDWVVGSFNIIAHRHLYDEAKLENIEDFAVVNDDFDFAKKNDIKGAFHKLDLHTDETCVGFFESPMMGKELFVFEAGYHFYGLKIGFEEYFQLLCKAKGFMYWQKCLLVHNYNKYPSTEDNQNFAKYMPKLFPDFNYESFLLLYDQLKLAFLKKETK